MNDGTSRNPVARGTYMNGRFVTRTDAPQPKVAGSNLLNQGGGAFSGQPARPAPQPQPQQPPTLRTSYQPTAHQRSLQGALLDRLDDPLSGTVTTPSGRRVQVMTAAGKTYGDTVRALSSMSNDQTNYAQNSVTQQAKLAAQQMQERGATSRKILDEEGAMDRARLSEQGAYDRVELTGKLKAWEGDPGVEDNIFPEEYNSLTPSTQKLYEQFSQGTPRVRDALHPSARTQGPDAVPAVLGANEAVLTAEAADEIGRKKIAKLNKKHAPKPTSVHGGVVHAAGGYTGGANPNEVEQPEPPDQWQRNAQLAAQAGQSSAGHSLAEQGHPLAPQRPEPSNQWQRNAQLGAQAARSLAGLGRSPSPQPPQQAAGDRGFWASLPAPTEREQAVIEATPNRYFDTYERAMRSLPSMPKITNEGDRLAQQRAYGQWKAMRDSISDLLPTVQQEAQSQGYIRKEQAAVDAKRAEAERLRNTPEAKLKRELTRLSLQHKIEDAPRERARRVVDANREDAESLKATLQASLGLDDDVATAYALQIAERERANNPAGFYGLEPEAQQDLIYRTGLAATVRNPNAILRSAQFEPGSVSPYDIDADSIKRHTFGGDMGARANTGRLGKFFQTDDEGKPLYSWRKGETPTFTRQWLHNLAPHPRAARALRDAAGG